jgi:transposase
MTTYSTDLRERVVRAYEKGDGSIRQLARRYEVSKNTVQAWLERKRSTGVVTPLPAKGGKVSQLVGVEEHLEAMVQTHPDDTLAQYCERWLEHQGVAVAESTMCRWLQQRELTLKKKHVAVNKRKPMRGSISDSTIGSK